MSNRAGNQILPVSEHQTRSPQWAVVGRAPPAVVGFSNARSVCDGVRQLHCHAQIELEVGVNLKSFYKRQAGSRSASAEIGGGNGANSWVIKSTAVIGSPRCRSSSSEKLHHPKKKTRLFILTHIAHCQRTSDITPRRRDPPFWVAAYRHR